MQTDIGPGSTSLSHTDLGPHRGLARSGKSLIGLYIEPQGPLKLRKEPSPPGYLASSGPTVSPALLLMPVRRPAHLPVHMVLPGPTRGPGESMSLNSLRHQSEGWGSIQQVSTRGGGTGELHTSACMNSWPSHQPLVMAHTPTTTTLAAWAFDTAPRGAPCCHPLLWGQW